MVVKDGVRREALTCGLKQLPKEGLLRLIAHIDQGKTLLFSGGVLEDGVP